MDEAHEILLSSLKSSGVSLPVGVSSIKGLSSAALVSICAQSIHMFLDCAPSSFPTSLPAVTAERFKICAELAAAIKSIGYRDELGFHQFLYPSDEESYKLVRFLVERLSKESSDGKKVGMTRPHDASKLEDEIKDLKRQEKLLRDEVHAETFRVQKLQDEHNILKMPLDLAVNRQQSNELCIQEPDAVVKSRLQGVMELEIKGNVAEHAIKEQRMNEQTFYSEQPEVQEWLIQLKDIEQEIEATLAEISKREAEHLDLLKEFEEQPKLPSRKSYIERITEITKNSRKLDADIKQILKETRELQLESNSIQERLHRTHAVADEVVFREAKKDAVGRLAYRHLSGIHDSFQQIADTILATDRAKREAAGLEAKLTKLSSRGFDIAKLQADLDSIRKENEAIHSFGSDRMLILSSIICSKLILYVIYMPCISWSCAWVSIR